MIYVAMPPPSYDKKNPCYAVHIGRYNNSWFVDHRQCGPVKLDFAFFPQNACCVLAHFDSGTYAHSDEPEYRVPTDNIRQQCARFVYSANQV